MSKQIARITWHCRRGMLELDLLLHRFVKNKINDLNDEELNNLEDLLSYPDPQLYAWLMGLDIPQDKGIKHIVELIKIQN